MSEFEKWLKEKGYNNPEHNDAYELGLLDGAKEGWIAALKWVASFTNSHSISMELIKNS